jgi:hypothetical protein
MPPVEMSHREEREKPTVEVASPPPRATVCKATVCVKLFVKQPCFVCKATAGGWSKSERSQPYRLRGPPTRRHSRPLIHVGIYRSEVVICS